MIEHSKKPLLPYNDYGLDNDLPSNIHFDDTKGADAKVNINFGTQQPAGRQGSNKKDHSNMSKSLCPCDHDMVQKMQEESY